ncbi:hypothetical protein DIPPA_16278 [Diplonema papillatum]|nr:hypothetical protein DIPPA_16278 [Diplonema papillatum]
MGSPARDAAENSGAWWFQGNWWDAGAKPKQREKPEGAANDADKENKVTWADKRVIGEPPMKPWNGAHYATRDYPL